MVVPGRPLMGTPFNVMVIVSTLTLLGYGTRPDLQSSFKMTRRLLREIRLWLVLPIIGIAIAIRDRRF
jgi:hypothetical protein